MDKNMLSLREQAKSLSIKHGLSEEALLIEEEERKLEQLMMEHDRAFEDIQSNSMVDHMQHSSLRKTNSGNHLISPT